MLTQAEKLQIITDFGTSAQDSGSTAVQIALLSKNIDRLQGHLTINKKDFSTKRGLMRMVNDRKQLLIYLKKCDPSSYADVIRRLGIRK